MVQRERHVAENPRGRRCIGMTMLAPGERKVLELAKSQQCSADEHEQILRGQSEGRKVQMQLAYSLTRGPMVPKREHASDCTTDGEVFEVRVQVWETHIVKRLCAGENRRDGRLVET
jgi:hypothetical protein